MNRLMYGVVGGNYEADKHTSALQVRFSLPPSERLLAPLFCQLVLTVTVPDPVLSLGEHERKIVDSFLASRVRMLAFVPFVALGP